MSRLDVRQTVKVEWLVRRPEEGGELANPHDPEPQQGAPPIRRTSCRSTERCLRVWLLLIRGAVREGLYALALLTLTGAVASAQPVCPGTATLTVFVENLSGAPTIAVELDGELAAEAATCGGSGATSYRETVTCTGSGVVRCGQLAALQPGTWVHRLSVSVPGSATQQEAQRLVLVAGSPADVSNALVWTIYPQTLVVQAASAAELQARLDDATAYTRENPGPALVIFSADAFPGAIAPQRIYLLQPPCSLDVTHNRCSPDGTWDGWTAGVCFLGDRIVVDALDRSAQPGGVILSVGTCGRQVLRLYGSDNVLRGLVFEGSRKPNPKPPCQVDTVAMTGARARRNRIEQSLFVGPTCGDTVSVDSDAGQPDDDGPGDNVIVDGRITNAADKGVKDDRCDGNGSCVGGAPLVCDGACLACDPMAGCVPKPVSAGCDDGDACTTGDHCSGDGNVCESGQAAVCGGPCLTGTCDPRRGCEPQPAGTACRPAAGPCDVAEPCSGTTADCPADGFKPATAR